ncbi:MAG: hypothetical protein R3C49_04805 [Planctomycetaceae bacterium]
MKLLTISLAVTLSMMAGAHAADWGLKTGTVDLKSAGALAMGPDGILFVGDPKGGAVFAIAADADAKSARATSLNLTDVTAAISQVVGGDVTINDIAANPASGSVFVSGSAGSQAVLVRIDSEGKVTAVDLKNAKFAKAELADAPDDREVGEGRRRSNPRNDSITDLSFFEGKVLVSGLRSSGSPSSVREINFPFHAADKGVGVQIFHAAHGREEDYAAMRTFVPLMIDGEPALLGAYVCTPLVRIDLKDLEAGGDKVKATTVAELGNRNRPLDMIRYTKGDQEYLLLSNSARGVMKITTAGLSSNKGLTSPVSGGGVAGQTYDSVESMNGVVQMDKLSETQAVILVDNNGSLDLKTVELP